MKYFQIASVLFLFMLSCKPHEPEPKPGAPYDRRDQFVGTYKVIDVKPNFYFKIEKMDSMGEPWVSVKNFANQFDMKLSFTRNRIPNNILDFDYYFPIRDNKRNKQWCFGVYGNDTVRNNCLLVNDTLRVFFRIHNTPWWGEDDTVYVNKFVVNTAVKQR